MTTTPPHQPTEADELVVAIRRMVRALQRRVSDDGDLRALAELDALADHVAAERRVAVCNLRNHPVYPSSWAELAGALRVTPRAVRKRYADCGGTRRPGGQPGHLR